VSFAARHGIENHEQLAHAGGERPPQRGLPCLAMRDLLPIQPFGLSAVGAAATFAARRDFSPRLYRSAASPTLIFLSDRKHTRLLKKASDLNIWVVLERIRDRHQNRHQTIGESRQSYNLLIFLVGGAGFEPATLGL
jgi:hypothetical protein